MRLVKAANASPHAKFYNLSTGNTVHFLVGTWNFQSNCLKLTNFVERWDVNSTARSMPLSCFLVITIRWRHLHGLAEYYFFKDAQRFVTKLVLVNLFLLVEWDGGWWLASHWSSWWIDINRNRRTSHAMYGPTWACIKRWCCVSAQQPIFHLNIVLRSVRKGELLRRWRDRGSLGAAKRGILTSRYNAPACGLQVGRYPKWFYWILETLFALQWVRNSEKTHPSRIKYYGRDKESQHFMLELESDVSLMTAKKAPTVLITEWLLATRSGAGSRMSHLKPAARKFC